MTQANLAAEGMFGRGDLTGEVLQALRGIVPETLVRSEDLAGDDALLEMLTVTGLVSSKGEARRLLAQGGVSVNRQKVADARVPDGSLVDGRYLLVQKGKKQRHLVVVDDH